jgi:uncharacterized membrane protein YfhO
MVVTVNECSRKDSMTYFYWKVSANSSVVNTLSLQLTLDRGADSRRIRMVNCAQTDNGDGRRATSEDCGGESDVV